MMHSDLYRRGIGKKLGELVYAIAMFVGSLGYAFYSDWKISLVVMCFLPVMAFTSFIFTRINQQKSIQAASAYERAAVIANSTVSAMRTLLSLNALSHRIELYADATLQAYRTATSQLWKGGFFSGEFY